MKKLLKTAALGLSVMALVGSAGMTAYAATTANSTLSQVINDTPVGGGTLSTDIRDAGHATVANPTFNMGAVNKSAVAQAATGTFGTDSQRIVVDNPDAADNGWTLTLNATTPGSGQWSDGSHSYPYNGTTTTGQLTVNPAAGNLTVATGAATGVSLGAQAAFTGSAPITILSANAASDDIWGGYVTGIGLSQVIPANQEAGTYTLPMTQTVTAI